jgi:hypothetical protein
VFAIELKVVEVSGQWTVHQKNLRRSEIAASAFRDGEVRFFSGENNGVQAPICRVASMRQSVAEC